jgi:ABC-type lipoprotein release transport system permease subunit
MNHRKIFLFALENLGAELTKYRGIFLLSILLVSLSASVIFLTSSLRYTILEALNSEPDFVVQKVVSQQQIPLPLHIGDELIEIAGTTKITQRIYGRYFIKGLQRSVLVMGVDFLDEQSHNILEKIIGKTDLNQFLSSPNAMIVGNEIAEWMQKNDYGKKLSFISPKGKRITLDQYARLPDDTALFSSDMVLTQLKNARKIFGLKRNEVTDFTFNAPNELEWEIIRIKVASLENGLRIIDKKESRKVYEEMFNFSGTFFYLLLLMVIIPFCMILYQRYTQVYKSEIRFIGILRASGWSIGNVLEIKFIETLFIIIIAYSIGISLAYSFVFFMGAPGLASLFLGAWNFEFSHSFVPHIDFFIMTSIFLLYALPFISVVLFPVWKIAITDPVKAMR